MISIIILRGLTKTLLVLFFLWHMSAVGIYSLYTVKGYPVLEWIESNRKYIRPYMLVTSQWQRWNLFSPDPLRRVTEMDIERFDFEHMAWIPVRTINAGHVPWSYRSSELKIMRRMEDERMRPFRENFLRVLCAEEEMPEGIGVRMRKRWFVIPQNYERGSIAWWQNWKPNWNEVNDTEIFCPPLS